MLLDPVIYEIEDPVSSLNIHLEGSGGFIPPSEIEGFYYSPSGGVFASGAIPSGYTWSYDFILMDQVQEFSIASYDASGNTSASAFTTLNYVLQSPVILTPGTPKVLTYDIATTGGTTSSFVTLFGDFKSDGIVPGDHVLGYSGKNKNVLREILEVNETILITEDFPFVWGDLDKIKIYGQEDRPTYNANKLYFQSTGIVDSSAESVVYTTDTNLELVRVYAEVEELYVIDSSNDTFDLVINGISQVIILPHGTDVTAAQIVSEINSYFPVTVAFLERLNPTSPYVFYLEGLTVSTNPSNALIYFEMCQGEFVFAKTVTASGDITSISDCEAVALINQTNIINIEVDGNIIELDISGTQQFIPKDLSEKLNQQAPKCIASAGTNSVVILAKSKLNSNNEVPYLDLNKGVTGAANLNKTEDKPDADWNLDFKVFANNFTLKVSASDIFGNRTDFSELPVSYKIDQPTLSTSSQSLITINEDTGNSEINSQNDVVTINGNFDSEGSAVIINDEPVFSINGTWTADIVLNEGENEIKIQTLDIFGTPSLEVGIFAFFTNPFTLPVVPQPVVAGGLRWSPVTTPTLGPDDVKDAAEVIADVFGTITDLLESVSGFLRIARAFIIDNILNFLNAVRIAIQSFIDDILETLNDLVNGAGIFILSTIPKFSEVSGTFDLLSKIQFDFSGFLNKIAASFDDSFDPFRPQLSQNVTAGGYVLAIADDQKQLGSLTLAQIAAAMIQIQEIVQKEILDYALAVPTNIRISSENQRNVITWKVGESIRPGKYIIERSLKAGGDPSFRRIKTNLNRPGQPNYTLEADIDLNTGQQITTYEKIGEMDFGLTLTDTTLVTEFDRTEFRFIDGRSTPYETLQRSKTEEVVQGAVNYLDAIKDFFLVRQESTEVPLQNGVTYYYKIRPAFTGTTDAGQSFELIGTPTAPELELINENLFDQSQNINPDDGSIGTRYILTGAVYNSDTAVYGSTFEDLEVRVDNATIIPKNVIYSKGIVYIDIENTPEGSIEFIYWTKRIINTTRARLAGSKQGDFTFRRIDPDGNTLSILVGPKNSAASNVGTQTVNATTISLNQKITFVRDWRGEATRTLTAEEVAFIIMEQTAGLRATVDRESRIVLIDDQNPNIYLGSKLEITKGNSVLGFEIGQTDIAGLIGGAPPDWFRLSMADLFPILNDALRFIENTAQSFLSSLEDATNAITEFLDTLISRVEALNEIIKRLQEIAERLAEILTISLGFWILKIPARPGGNEYLKQALITSTNRPNSSFTAGIIFVYGDGATQKALDFMFGPVR